MKQQLIALLFRLRLFALWRFLNRRKITILMLHGVSDPSEDAGWQPLWARPSVDQFATTLKQFSKHYRFLSLGDAVSILNGTAPPVEHGMVVTFDDGYRNNFSAALPVMNELGIPATFFVASGYVESGRAYWVDRLDYALQHVDDSERVLKSDKYEFDLRGLDHAARAVAYRELRLTIKSREDDDYELSRVVDAFAASLEAKSGRRIADVIDTDPDAAIATWSEQRAAIEAGATIGCHTVDHHRLTAIPAADVDAQLLKSRESIRQNLNIECEFFCYPNGSQNAFVAQRVARAGYAAAVATRHGLNAIGDDLFKLKRLPMPFFDSAEKNLLHVSGILVSRLVRKFRGLRR